MEITITKELLANITKIKCKDFDVIFFNKRNNNQNIKVCCMVLEHNFFYEYDVSWKGVLESIKNKAVAIETTIMETNFFDIKKYIILGQDGSGQKRLRKKNVNIRF